MRAAIGLFLLPLILINVLGAIASGVWLLLLGDWWTVGYGIAAIAVSLYTLGIVLMPGQLFAAVGATLVDKGKILPAAPLLFAGLLYANAVASLLCLASFHFFLGRANGADAWPSLIWSYGVAMAPWINIMRREENNYAVATAFFAQIACIATCLAGFVGLLEIEMAYVFVGIMVIGLLLQIADAVLGARRLTALSMTS